RRGPRDAASMAGERGAPARRAWLSAPLPAPPPARSENARVLRGGGVHEGARSRRRAARRPRRRERGERALRVGLHRARAEPLPRAHRDRADPAGGGGTRRLSPGAHSGRDARGGAQPATRGRIVSASWSMVSRIAGNVEYDTSSATWPQPSALNPASSSAICLAEPLSV